MRTFPIIRDLVTDVSFNYEVAKTVPPFAAAAPSPTGGYRMQQIDVERGQEFRKCIECFMCQDVCHVIRDHEENKTAYAGSALLHPLRRARDAPARHQRPARAPAPGARPRACATSPSAAPRSAPSTSRSPTTRIIPLKERVVDASYDPVAWLGRKILKRTKKTAEEASAG